MRLSATPLLLLVLLALIAMATRRTARQRRLSAGEARSIYSLLALLAGWGVVTSTLAIMDFYSSPRFLELWPGLWLPLVPFVLVIGSILIFSRLRSALRAVTAQTPWHFQVYVHAMRILAIGTMVKAFAGVFPAYFAFLVGIPDFLFGASAFLFGRYAYRRTPSRRSR